MFYKEEHVFYSLADEGYIPIDTGEEVPGIDRSKLTPKQLDILKNCFGCIGEETFLFDMECYNAGELVTRAEWIRRRVLHC